MSAVFAPVIHRNGAAAYGQPHLRLVHSSSQPMERVYRRRRLVAAALISLFMLAAANVAQAGVSWAWHQATQRPTVAAVPVAAVSAKTVTVLPGDSLWAIVSRAKPGSDPRPIVAELSKQRKGAPLQVGERITIPD